LKQNICIEANVLRSQIF